MAYAKFTPEMKKTYTILAPNMLPIHFHLLIRILEQFGYHVVLLESTSRTVVEEGLKNVHNDTCYPALLVVGQFMEALKSGKYDVDHTALLITQTGGGCRASNYIHLLRKCVADQFPNVPVISLNFAGLEKDSSLELTPALCIKMVYAVLYADMLMTLFNQCRPYELNEGESQQVLDAWQEKLPKLFESSKYLSAEKIYAQILKDFAAIPRSKKPKIKVGIIGEIYVKYSPLANNHLEDFLISEGCEPVVPTLLEFVLYCAANTETNSHLYDYKNFKTLAFGLGYKFLHSKQVQMIKAIQKHGEFTPPHDFEDLRRAADKYISQGVSMGEGWMITAEMAVLAETGTENIICTQPFGCLPNHIVAKGMARTIKNAYPNANIVAIDYDPGATRVNQENRIKLMLANAGWSRRTRSDGEVHLFYRTPAHRQRKAAGGAGGAAACAGNGDPSGFVDFYAGGALGWDTYCAQTVLDLREEYPCIALHLVLPCSRAEQTARWTEAQKAAYDCIYREADSCEFVSVDYTKDCMRLRNKRLVELADCCVCFCGEPEGRSGTAQTVRMARQKGIPVINLAS